MTSLGRTWLVLIWLCLLAAAVFFIQRDALSYVNYTESSYGKFWPLRYWLVPHILGAMTALLLGPIQFSATVRRRWPRLHRYAGRVYVLGIVVGSIGAMHLALSSSRILAAPPLFILATLWLSVTVTAFWLAYKRRISVHRQFIIRSYVFTCAFVVIRLPFPFKFGLSDPQQISATYEWLVLIVPLLCTEIWLAWVPMVKGGTPRARA